jgi:hypothetical protein
MWNPIERDVMTIEEVMTKCCGSGSRYSIDKPFRRGAYVWATNGHILARVPATAYRSCGDEHDCGECDGYGTKYVDEESVKIGTVCIGKSYARMLQRFGVTEICATGDKELHPIYWSNGTVEGMLMQKKT